MTAMVREDGSLHLGIIRETKTDPPDVRVPLTPLQCRDIIQKYPNVHILVQSSPARCYSDAEYKDAGIEVADEIASRCDVLIGVKEAAVSSLVKSKTYFFFSHTIKKQPYNQKLLRSVLDLNIRLVDYECLRCTTPEGKEIVPRSVAFGRWAGIVGAHNGLLTWGLRTGLYKLPRLYQCKDYKEGKLSYSSINFGAETRVAVTGDGQVSTGSVEVLEAAGLKRLTPEEFIASEGGAVYCQLPAHYLYLYGEEKTFNDAFFQDPSGYRSVVWPYLCKADVLINGIYWDKRTEPLFTAEQMKDPAFRVKVIADITCDIAPESSIPSTLRSTTIASPFYGYDPATGKEVEAFSSKSIVDVMAIDNLPNELARDASEDFGIMMIEKILPEMLNASKSNMLTRASITENGSLTSNYTYLQDYADGKLI